MNEYTERKDMSTDVVCMALANVPQGTYTVRIISLDPNDCLTPLSMQALPDSPEYLRHLKAINKDYTPILIIIQFAMLPFGS